MTESVQAESAQPRYIDVDPSEEPTIRMLAVTHGIKVERVERLGIEPVTTVALVLMGTAAAIAAFFEQLKGGQVIDLRPNARREFYRTSKVGYGTVIIFAEDGKVTVNIKNPDGMFDKVTSALPRLLSRANSAGQVVEIVTKTIGADAEIETAETPNEDGDM